MATNSITSNKQNPDQFSLLYELKEFGQGTLLIYNVISFLDNIDNIDCLNTLSKTCKFFNETLKNRLDKFKQMYELYLPLTNHIFENWQEIAKLPKLDESFENKQNFSKEDFDKLSKSIMIGNIKGRYVKSRPCIFFKTVIRNFDGTFNRFDIELLIYTTDLTNPAREKKQWQYQTKKCGLISMDNLIANHLKSLLKHEKTGEIIVDQIDPEEKLIWIEDDEVIRFIESDIKTTKDGKPIVELVSDEL